MFYRITNSTPNFIPQPIYQNPIKPSFSHQKQPENTQKPSLFNRFSPKINYFSLKNQSKNRLFTTFSGVFESKSVPNVPSVSLVP